MVQGVIEGEDIAAIGTEREAIRQEKLHTTASGEHHVSAVSIGDPFAAFIGNAAKTRCQERHEPCLGNKVIEKFPAVTINVGAAIAIVILGVGVGPRPLDCGILGDVVPEPEAASGPALQVRVTIKERVAPERTHRDCSLLDAALTVGGGGERHARRCDGNCCDLLLHSIPPCVEIQCLAG